MSKPAALIVITIIVLLTAVFIATFYTPEPHRQEVYPETLPEYAPVETPPPEEVEEIKDLPFVDVPNEPASPPRVVKHEEYDPVPVGSGEVQGCPERYFYAGGYCIEHACENATVKCIKSGGKIMRPECECWIYMGDPICSIKAGENTRVNSPLCTRKGQAGQICGAYDSNKKRCETF